MKWAVAQGCRQENPAEAIDQALPKHDKSKIKHRLSLPYADVAGAIGTVKQSGAGVSAKLAFEFLVLTATRSGEVRLAVWDEIDFDKREWAIPAECMKAKRAHRVPLSERAIEILTEARNLSDGSGLIFIGTKQGKPLSDMTLSKLLKELGIAAAPHGFRTSFKVWAQEQTNFFREVSEMALAHVIQNKAEAAYARFDLFEKRRKMMESWAIYICTLRGDVVKLRTRQ